MPRHTTAYTQTQTYIHVYICNYVYIYIYIERERDTYTDMYIYIYIYTHIMHVLSGGMPELLPHRGAHMTGQVKYVYIYIYYVCAIDNNTNLLQSILITGQVKGHSSMEDSTTLCYDIMCHTIIQYTVLYYTII